MQPSSNVGLCLLFLCGVFETFPSLINYIFVFIHEISLAVSQHILYIYGEMVDLVNPTKWERWVEK